MIVLGWLVVDLLLVMNKVIMGLLDEFSKFDDLFSFVQ